MLNLLKAHLPNTRVLFASNPSKWHKVRELGLTMIYKEIPEVKRVVRKLMALAFLPVLAVCTIFSELSSDPAATKYGLLPLFAYCEHYMTTDLLYGMFMMS